MKQRNAYIGLLVLLLSVASLTAQNVVRVQAGTELPIEYSDFEAGWTYAMSQTDATVTLLDDVTCTSTIHYKPTVADARTVLDLNNCTLTAAGPSNNGFYINKADAELTITDNSIAQGGLITMTGTSTISLYTLFIAEGTVQMTGGRIYCQNDQDDGEWHPAIALYVGPHAALNMTGGTLEAGGKCCIYPLYSYGTTDLSDGTIHAHATGNTESGTGSATAVNVIHGITTIRGTAHIISSSPIIATGVSVGAWINDDGTTIQQGTLYIEGGTIDVTASERNALGVQASAHVIRIGSTNYQGHGTAYISGGTITVTCSAPTASQVFAAQSTETRLFDDETPHHLIAAEGGVMNISGGTFVVDTRDHGAFIDNAGNVDLLRSWGTLNVTGGTFTIYQKNSPSGIGTYRGKTTVSGNPVFNILACTNARGVFAAPWNHSNYCDADASKNMAEIEVNGGTFHVKAIEQNAIGAYTYGSISTASETGDAGYAMSGKITINGGEFICTSPAFVRCLIQYDAVTGAYGTAKRILIVKGGKFKAQIATVNEDGTIGEITNTGYNFETGGAKIKELVSGYYETMKGMVSNIDDSCAISMLSSADPEYAEGYRYKVVKGPYVVRMSSDEPDRLFAWLARAVYCVQNHADATLTILDDIDYLGETLVYNPTVANAKCVLDLNGHNVSAKDLFTSFLQINNPNAVFTFRDSGSGGRFGMIHSTSYGITVLIRQGKLILESGTISCDITGPSMSAYTMRADAYTANDARFEMKGGTIEAHSFGNSYALLTRSTSDGIGYATVKGGEIWAYSDGANALAVTAAGGGHITIEDNPKVVAQNASSAQAIRTESNGKLIVKSGRFSSNAGRIVAGTDIAITGGFFTERSGSYYKGLVEAFCIPPYHTFPTTAAEQAAYGAEYVWKVEPLPESGFYADIIDVDNTNHRLLLNVSDWEIDGWPYTINGVAYAKTQRAADRTMTIPYSGAPGDEFYLLVKKTSGDIASHHPYTLPLEITSPTTLTANENKPLFVKGTTLTVDANITAKNIYVGPEATLCINSGKTLTADAVILRTTPSSAAQLLKNGAIDAGTNVYYTRIVASKAGYFPFGLPVSCLTPINAVRLSNGTNPDYKAGSGWVLRSYDEASRATYGPSDAGANWRTHDGTSTIVGGKGYEMYSGVNYYREFYFPIDISMLTDEVAVTHTDGKPTDAGWNLLVSPLTYTYSNSVAPEGLAVSWLLSDGSFEQEIPDAIPPVAAFAFQAQTNGVLSFAGSSLAAAAPLRKAPTEEQIPIQWLHLDIRDAKGVGDQTSIYAHPTRYDETYKTGIDVAKQSFTASRALLYSSHAYGEMAFAGVSDSLLMRGVTLTIYSPVAQELTISMRANNWLGRLDHVWLVDYETGVRTDLLTGDYTFDAAAGTTTARLAVEGEFPSPQISMENELVPADETLTTKAGKFLWQNKMFIRVNGRIYDANGKLITAK